MACMDFPSMVEHEELEKRVTVLEGILHAELTAHRVLAEQYRSLMSDALEALSEDLKP